MKNSKIGWTHHTWNPWWGCNKVSPACQHCYIGQIMRRSGNEPFHGPMRTKTAWRNPHRWDHASAMESERHRVFTCSMSDYFHPGADAWRDEAWKVIQSCTNLDWLILTKRPELIRDRLPNNWGNGYPNVWMGVTVEDQRQISRVDLLAEIPASVRFVSAEPLLGPVHFGRRLSKLNWIITGCEKAAKSKRRSMDLNWVRNICKECEAANVAMFHKQYYRGNRLEFDGLLDGKVHQAWPTCKSSISIATPNCAALIEGPRIDR